MSMRNLVMVPVRQIRRDGALVREAAIRAEDAAVLDKALDAALSRYIAGIPAVEAVAVVAEAVHGEESVQDLKVEGVLV
jgi:hypothetical protein